ncbi:MAG: hypothetical protein Q9164_007604, partial [Protoblastenia rupestris]
METPDSSSPSLPSSTPPSGWIEPLIPPPSPTSSKAEVSTPGNYSPDSEFEPPLPTPASLSEDSDENDEFAEGDYDIKHDIWRCTQCGWEVETDDDVVGYCKEGHLIDLRNIEDFYVGYVVTPEESEHGSEDIVLASDHESDEEEEAKQLEIGDDGGEGLYKDRELLPVDTGEAKEMR